MLTVLLSASSLFYFDSIVMDMGETIYEKNDGRWDQKARMLKSQRQQFALRLPTINDNNDIIIITIIIFIIIIELVAYETRQEHALQFSNPIVAAQKSLRFVIVWRTVYTSYILSEAVYLSNPVIHAAKHMSIECTEKRSAYSFQEQKLSMLEKCNKKNCD